MSRAVSPFGPETPLAPDESPCFPYDPMPGHFPWFDAGEHFVNTASGYGESVMFTSYQAQKDEDEFRRDKQADWHKRGFSVGFGSL